MVPNWEDTEHLLLVVFRWQTGRHDATAFFSGPWRNVAPWLKAECRVVLLCTLPAMEIEGLFGDGQIDTRQPLIAFDSRGEGIAVHVELIRSISV